MEHRKYNVTRTGMNSFENSYIDSCRNCDGSGMVKIIGSNCSTVIMCNRCLGTGEVQVTKKIEVIVKPYKNQ